MAHSDREAPFLTAQWRHLAMLNYAVDPGVLTALVPAGTELDSRDGRHFVTVVGFLFLDTRLRGFRIPWHADFEEVNLRFYVRRKNGSEWRRGVVFVRELVPRLAVAAAARLLYNENYSAVPMGHDIVATPGSDSPVSARYWWKFRGRRGEVQVTAAADPAPIEPGSEEEFIIDQAWGYSAQRDGGTVEYRVEHPPWLVRSATMSRLEADVKALYGKAFEDVLRGEPWSAFLAEGSRVAVFSGRRLGR